MKQNGASSGGKLPILNDHLIRDVLRRMWCTPTAAMEKSLHRANGEEVR